MGGVNGKFLRGKNGSVTDAAVPAGSEIYSGDLDARLKKAFLHELCVRPTVGLTEVRRDGKDNAAIAKVITKEFNRCAEVMDQMQFVYHMRTYATACWVSILLHYL